MKRKRGPQGLKAAPLQGAILLLLILGTLGACHRPRGADPAKRARITVAVPPLEQNALLYVAEHRGYFAAHGLEIAIKDYDSGVTSIQGLLRGEAEIAEAAEFPLVRAIFRKEELLIIGCNDRFENNYLIARQDRGIAAIPDLRGKKIGVTLQTINEFYLARFLQLHGICWNQVEVVDTQPADFLQAVAGGAVDALIGWQPHIYRIQQQLSETLVWPAQSSQEVYGVLVCRREWVVQHAEVVRRYLRALLEAENYLLGHPDQAKTIVRERLHYDDSYIAAIWPQHRFALSLDQTLIIAMKDEAQWLINNRLTPEAILPDFADYIYTEALQAIKPEAVSILR